jgi:hypothetical protein
MVNMNQRIEVKMLERGGAQGLEHSGVQKLGLGTPTSGRTSPILALLHNL